MNAFDQAARYAARKLDPAEFVPWVRPEIDLRVWRWGGLLESQLPAFPGEPERRPDLVAYFERSVSDAPPMAVIVEFMSRHRSITVERLAEYCLRLRRLAPYQKDPLVRYSVVGVLVNLTGEIESDAWGMEPPDCGGLGWWGKIGACNLSQRNARATLAAIASGALSRGMLPWVPLLQGAEDPAVVAEWRVLADAEPDAGTRGDYGGLALVFAELAERRPVWQKGLEGWNMVVSEVVREWQAQAEARGRAEERVITVRDKLLRVLQVRFGAALPADVMQVVQSQGELATLDAWFDRALVAASLEEVRAALGLPGMERNGGPGGTS